MRGMRGGIMGEGFKEYFQKRRDEEKLFGLLILSF